MFEKTQTRKNITTAAAVARVPSVRLQRKCACGGSSAGECEDCKKNKVQRKTAGGSGPAVAPPIVHEVLSSPGQPLDSDTRSLFEPRFGHDFSKVRVHTDEKAAESAQAVNSLAYTVGRDVVFGAGQYAPTTASGRSLLAHELTHVVQQGHGPVSSPLHIGSPEDSQEATARRIEATAGVAVEPGLAPGRRRIASQPKLQRKDPDPDISTMDWAKAYDLAEKTAKTDKSKALGFYKQLVVRAASKVTASSPLKDKKPAVADVNWNWTKTKDYGATTDPKLVDKSPAADDYWKWITFNPSGILNDEAFTASVILHELDHAAHAKALYDEWKKAKSKQAWVDFYLDHFSKWTEKPITVKKSGLAGALAGLPEKITPSAIEFRAYVNQFVNFFHKVSVDNQSYFGKTVVLFYPLKTQKVSEKISDPSLDVAASRQQLLDYFKSPPVSDKTQQEVIKNRVATEFKSALILFRPDADQAQIRKDFKEIVEFEVDSDQRKEARKSYKPQPL